jgi:hypothetical protein
MKGAVFTEHPSLDARLELDALVTILASLFPDRRIRGRADHV